MNETTVADQLKKAGYATGICGKWHLGEREMFLPAARGFDEYLGIPYSDDMGGARATPCGGESGGASSDLSKEPWWEDYCEAGFCNVEDVKGGDPAGAYLPLVHQINVGGKRNTTVVEQPLDFTHLAKKYSDFVTSFIDRNAKSKFFLYVPFSHVHTTNPLQPSEQYASCPFKNTTSRGSFGDALAEVDWIIGNIVDKLDKLGLREDTLILFTGDNGPWMIKGASAGSPGLLYGRSAGYWNVGKGSTWEGGIHEAAFANWKGTIAEQTKSDEVVSSLDLLPTASALAGVDLPKGVTFDGKNMLDVLLDKGKSKHDALFFYGGASCSKWKGPSAVRFGDFKAHFATGPGLGGCTGCEKKCFCDDPSSGDCEMLLFNVRVDPSEAYPLEDADVKASILKALQTELETFTWGKLVAPPDQPGEGPNRYGVCCDRKQDCDCDGPLPR